MKITYLKLKNFAGIYTALSKETLELKFNPVYKIMLLVGPNGSGKTTILSTLHPFAYPGNMDIRHGSSIIMKDKVGMKEIHFEKNGLDIKVKHVYTPSQTGHSVKSFITVDGEEKNPNGNVRSFTEMVSLYLDVESDFLKLSRLGSNVTGLISMKSTERKKYMSNILSDVDTYTNFYKKINKDFASLNTLMKSLNTKLSKINLGDKDVALNTLSELQNILDKDTETHNKIISDISEVNFICSDIQSRNVFESIKETSRTITSSEKEIVKLLSDKDRLTTIIKNINKDELDSEISSIEKKMIEYTVRNDMILSELNEAYERKEFLEFNLKENDKINDMIKLSEKMKEAVKVSKSKLRKFKLNLSENELYQALHLLNELKDMYSDGISYIQPYMIKSVYDIMKSGKSIDRYINENVSKVDKEISYIEREIRKLDVSFKTDDTIEIFYDLTDSCDDCPYKKKVLDGVKEPDRKTIKDLNSKKENLLLLRENYLNMKSISMFIKTIESKILSNKDICTKMCISIGEVLNGKDFINEKEWITDDISLYEDIKEIEATENEITRLELKISEQNSLNNNSPNELKELSIKIDSLLNEKDSIHKDLISTQSIFNEKKELSNSFEEYNNIDIKISTLSTELDSLKKMYDGLTKEAECYRIANIRKTELEKERMEVNNKIIANKNEIDKLKYRIMSYDECIQELESLEAEYSDLSILRESLSSSKGIPVLFIKLYLKNTTAIVNGILKDLFNNTIELEDFVIDENTNEFRMPYIKNGLTVSDISFASQGETSIVSVALSFALMEQSMKSYNVLLLDEVDSTLDDKNRRLFIPLLSDRLDRFGCEQVFMISHNNAFDNAPVDILMTSEVDIDNFKNIGQVIKI